MSTTGNNDSISEEYQKIKDEAEIVACKLAPLNQKKGDFLTKEIYQMYEFDRPSVEIWSLVYGKLRLKGWTEVEVVSWLQSKNVRWLLDGAENMFDKVAQKIANCASKDQLDYPVEIAQFVDYEIKPDIFISRTEEDGVKVYSNQPEDIGRILVFEPSSNTEFATEMKLYSTDPEKLTKDADKWQTALETGKVDLVQFLEKFITNNS